MTRMQSNRTRVEMCRLYLDDAGYKVGSSRVYSDGGQYELLVPGVAIVYAMKSGAFASGEVGARSRQHIYVLPLSSKSNASASAIVRALRRALPRESFVLVKEEPSHD